jgi:TPR repeat protein
MLNMKKLLMLISMSTLAQICYSQLSSTNSSKTPVSFNYYWVETVTPEGALVRLGQLNTIDGQEYFVYGFTNAYLQKNYSGSDRPVAGVRTNDYFYKTDGGMMKCAALVQISEEELVQIATNSAEASVQNAQQQLAYVDALKQSNMIGAAEKSFYYLERDATNGSPISQYALGYKYIIGEYPAQTNTTLGIYWIQKAAAKGNKDAKQFLNNTD